MKEVFITLKDHKENFANKPTCRLINPSKPEIGRISKQLLEEINGKLVNIKKVNQWKNTTSVLQWFDRLTNKSDLAFICFDVVEFNPSISEALLNRVLDFASEHLNISASERQTIINSKHSLLFSEGQPWEKRNSASNFDITMGSYDGTETCANWWVVTSYRNWNKSQALKSGFTEMTDFTRDRENKKRNMPNIYEEQPKDHHWSKQESCQLPWCNTGP